MSDKKLKEIRSIGASTALFEKREDGSKSVHGIAAPFNSDSVDFGYFTERYAPGCFQRTLKEKPDIRALVDHDTGLIVGRTTAGNLELREDSEGLAYSFTPPDTTLGRDLAYNIENRILTNVSIGFVVREEKWTALEDKTYLRTLLDVDLWEMSFVSFPAYIGTTAEMRSVEDAYKRGIDLLNAANELTPESVRAAQQKIQDERAARLRKIAIAMRR